MSWSPRVDGPVFVRSAAGTARVVGVVAMAFVLAACGDEPVEPTPAPVPVSITITAPDTKLFAGSTVQLSAQVYGDAGQVLNVEVQWSSSDTTVASVNGRGAVTALQTGAVRIRATYGNISSSIDMLVEHHPDRAVLVDLYHALDGPNWVTPEGPWLTDRGLDAWHGVETDLRGNVTRLSLPGAGLKGSLPPAIGGLEKLAELDLSGNAISGPIPPEIAALQSLERLNLGGNPLSGPIPAELGTLESLTSLFLGNNRFSGPIPPELGRLTSLERLNLEGNQLSGPIPPELGQLTSLRTLDLRNNQLQSIPAEIGGLAELRLLVLERNRLSGAIPPELGQLRQLWWLLLDRNQLTGGIPPELAELQDLRLLSLSNNPLSGLVPTRLTELWGLDMVDLHGTRVCALPTPELSRWLARIDRPYLNECTPAQLDEAILIDLYRNSGGTEWRSSDGWTGERPLGEWHGVDAGTDGRVTGLALRDNGLAGPFPHELAYLEALQVLDLADNPGLQGEVESRLAELDLRELHIAGTELCGPRDTRFLRWWEAIPDRSGSLCLNPEAIHVSMPMWSLNQAIQDGRNTRLIAGRDAFLRVFPVADERNWYDARLRGEFFHGDTLVHGVTIDRTGNGGIATGVDYSRLDGSLNAVIPGVVLVPGVEMVLTLDSAALPLKPGSRTRSPTAGRHALPVVSVPDLELVLVPVLSTQSPDSSVVRETNGLTEDSPLVAAVRHLLPVSGFEVTVRTPHVTSLAMNADNLSGILLEIDAVRKNEGGSGYWVGLVRRGLGGQAAGNDVSVAALEGDIIAHEVGHNMSLLHAPCGGPDRVDPAYPDPDGRVGTWGYNPRGRDIATLGPDTLVHPRTADVMSYCQPTWISGYHFEKALRYRLQVQAQAAAVESGTQRRQRVLLIGGHAGPEQAVLESAVLLNAPPSLPESSGPYRIEGFGPGGELLFSLRFAPEIEAESGRGLFVFLVPYDQAWAGSLGRIELTGPAGSDVLDATTDRPFAVVTDPGTGRITAILRGVDALEGADARVRFAEQGDLSFSRGLPDLAALRKRR